MNPEATNFNQNLAVPQQFNVTNNQQYVPQGEEARIREALRTTSQYIRCLGCQYAGLTSVERKLSCANVCCCALTTPLLWLCYQSCRAKDINCFDAVHTCTKCGNKIGNYEACS